MNRRLKYFSINDASIGWYLPRLKEVVDEFREHPKEFLDLQNVLELVNVVKYIEADLFLLAWSTQDIKNIKNAKPEILKFIGEYFGKTDVATILGSVKELDYNYYCDFFTCFEKYKLAKKIEEADFAEFFGNLDASLRHLLRSQYFAKSYSGLMKNLVLSNPLSIQLLLSNYSGSGHEKLYFPDNITNNEWNRLCDDYINAPTANPNYLAMLENPIISMDSKKFFSITPKQKLLIKDRINQSHTAIINNDSGVRAGAAVYIEKTIYDDAAIKTMGTEAMSPREAIDRSFLNSIIASSGAAKPEVFTFEINALVDRRRIDEHHDFTSLMQYLRDDYGLFSHKIISTLPSYPNSEMGSVEKNVGINTDNAYVSGILFSTKQRLAISIVNVFSLLLEQHNLRIEDIVAWFFSEHCKEQYGISWLSLDTLSKNVAVKHRTAALFNIEEGIRKQYSILLSDGEINDELIDFTSTPPICQLPSYQPRKYAYSSGSQEAERILFLLFSDQSIVNYIDDNLSGENLTDLIEKHILKLSDFHDYQKPCLTYLIERAVLEECQPDNALCFRDISEVEILRELYLFGSTSYIHASKDERLVLEQMESKGLVVFDNTLFTKQETDYLNFLLNNKYFDNSWAIRNRYKHDYPHYRNPQQYNLDYELALLILLIYVIKIDDELRVRSTCVQS